ncbi:exocyst complex component 8 [Planococcus citri]|uniref:exocyst complex component 8 n=1 Tax=Planococcus citri TaxID=170843 RepID=UPI0031F8B211
MNVSLEQFDSPNFNPNKYVKEISHGCVGGVEFQQQRLKIQNIADETSNLLKKNVYRNYTLFIETAKEISRLEGDMYQLSHLLSEQRSLLSTLATTSMFEDQKRIHLSETESKDDDEDADMKRRQALSDVAEKIEGCINLTENSGRQYLYEGDLTELDAIDNSQICKLRAYLLSDVLLLASTTTSRRSPAVYKLETVYDVNNLAIVNVKDVKNAIKLLAFPDTRVFQVTSSQAKKEWLEKFDEAKKLLMTGHSRKRGSISVEQKSPARNVNVESTNPFDEVEDEVDSGETVPGWLLEVAEDLDVLIVERHFEDAYFLIEKTKNYLKENPPANEILIQDIQGKVDIRVKTLTQILTKELEITPEKSHQGGLRAARRSVRLLNTLQKSTQACDLFLKLCSNILKSQLSTVKGETTNASYVRQLSAVFFSNLCYMAKEFQYQAFPNNPYCASSFIVWCTKEVSNFVSRLVRQVFFPQVSLAILHKCVEHLKFYSKQLSDDGIDVIYLIDGHLRTPLTRILLETRNKLAESVNTKIVEEKWHLTNLKSKQQTEKLVSEFNNLGISGTEKYIQDACFFQLTSNTIWFCRVFIQFIENSAFEIASIEYEVEQAVCDILLRFTEQIIQALYNEEFRNERRIIEINGKFLAEEFIPFCEALYRKRHKIGSIKLKQIRNEFNDSLNENTITG